MCPRVFETLTQNNLLMTSRNRDAKPPGREDGRPGKLTMQIMGEKVGKMVEEKKKTGPVRQESQQ